MTIPQVLVTGATGFVGKRLVHHLRDAGADITALVRRSGDWQPLQRAGVNVVFGDLRTGEGLADAVRGADWVFHLAAATSARKPEDLFQTNAVGTGRLCRAIAESPQPPRLVYCSSLAARGLGRSGPVSAYGASKRAGEDAVRDIAGQVPCVILRPPIVYGPGDKAFTPALLAGVRLGFLFTSGPGERWYSLLHVDDLCAALLAAAKHGQTVSRGDPGAGVYTLDSNTYELAAIGREAAQVIGRKTPKIVAVPPAVMRALARGCEALAAARGRSSIFNRDKVTEMSCAAWTCSSEKAVRELGFAAAGTLTDGLSESRSS